jgi:hypothetical protein
MIPDRSLRCVLAGRPLRRFRCRTRRNASLTGRAPPIVMQKLQHNKVSSFSDRLDCAAVEGSSVDDLLKLACRNDRGYPGAELISDAPSMGDDRPPAAQQACDEGRERRRRPEGLRSSTRILVLPVQLLTAGAFPLSFYCALGRQTRAVGREDEDGQPIPRA